MAERSFAREVEDLKLAAGEIFRGEGILAITKALLQSGVSYVGGYQGSPISHLMDVLADAKDVLSELGVHFETSASEATAAATLAASVMYPVRGAVTWKSTAGTNVALPFAFASASMSKAMTRFAANSARSALRARRRDACVPPSREGLLGHPCARPVQVRARHGRRSDSRPARGRSRVAGPPEAGCLGRRDGRSARWRLEDDCNALTVASARLRCRTCGC